jgi:prolyl-tRNA synthetase
MIINEDVFKIDLLKLNTNEDLLKTCNYIKLLSNGFFIFLDKGVAIIENIKAQINTLLAYFDIKQILLPSIISSIFFENRIKDWEKNLFLIKKQKKIEYILSPTGEEIMTYLMKQYITSYKQLPLHIYQISNKFRREKSGHSLYRSKEFIMKDSYGFFLNNEQMINDWNLMKEIYLEFFRIVKINNFIIQKEFQANNEMKSNYNMEFLVQDDIGESLFFFCKECKIIKEKNIKCKCNKDLKEEKFIEIAHLFQLGTYYSEKFNLFINYQKKKKFISINSYGIGISRLLFTIYLKLKDEYGIVWPISISPEIIRIIPINNKYFNKSIKIYHKINFLFDNKKIKNINLDLRKQYRLGYKIKDALLNGVNFIIIIGNKIKEQNIELYIRQNYPKKYIITIKEFINLLILYKKNI